MGKVNQKQMGLAIDAYLKGKMSIREAATAFGVAKSSLSDRLLHGGRDKPIGRPTLLGESTEKLIVELLTTCSDMGFSLTCSETLDIVESYLSQNGQSKLFKNGRPSEDWYYDFTKRHDELTIRTSNNMASNRTTATNEETSKVWFEKIEKIYNEHNFHQKPCHIFKIDEIGMICDQGNLIFTYFFLCLYLKFLIF